MKAFANVEDAALVKAFEAMTPRLQRLFFQCRQREASGILRAFLAPQEEANLAVGLAKFHTAAAGTDSTQDRVF